MTPEEILAVWAKIAPVTRAAQEFAAEMAGQGRFTVTREIFNELRKK